MNRLILTLIVISAVLVKINAQCSTGGHCPPPGTFCAVGESELAQGGFCQEAKGDDACKAHCEKSYGAELIKAECSAERANKQKECICQLNCQNGGCQGDPHCWSWDGTLFNYQGLRKYYVFKSKTPFKTVPQFEIIQSNHPWCGGSAATLDTLNFIILDWGQNVQIVAPVNQPLVLTVNGKSQSVPGRYSNIKGHRENFIDFKNPDPSQLVITTSFGVQVTVHNNGGYSDLSINIPRHPEFKNNTWGVLSSWNDNPADDNLDGNGKPQSFADEMTYGNTFMVAGEKIPTQAELDEDKKHHEDHVKNFNKEHWQHLEKMCDTNMNHGEMKHCMRSLGRPAHLVRDCAYDLSHIIEEAHQHAFLKAKVEHFKRQCRHHQLEYIHHKRPENIRNHEPLPIPVQSRRFHEEREERRRRRPHGDDREPDDFEGRERRPNHRRPEDGEERCRERPEDGEGRRRGDRPEGGRGRGRSHPFLPHHKWGKSKPEHKDRCFKAKEHVKKESVKLLECLAFEGWFEEEN